MSNYLTQPVVALWGSGWKRVFHPSGTSGEVLGTDRHMPAVHDDPYGDPVVLPDKANPHLREVHIPEESLIQ
jgi:hypothetical protein